MNITSHFHAHFKQMKLPRLINLANMPRKSILVLLIISFSVSTISESQTGLPPPGLFCISDCETCPVICSPPPSMQLAPPATPKSPLPPPPPPPPPVQHHSPPQGPPPFYYFGSPSPSYSPPAHPPPKPPPPAFIIYGGATPPPPPPAPQLYMPWGGGAPAPPQVNVYNPGTKVPPGMGQRNFSFPYYYFYASKASCFFPMQFQGVIVVLVAFVFVQVL